MAERPRIVIVGGGFAGLQAAQVLARSPVDVLMVDVNNYHTFFPLLYQVAAAELEPEDIIYPLRSTFRRHKNLRLLVDRLTGLDLERRCIITATTAIPYDYLILAIGSAPHFFGVEGAEQFALQLKTIEDAITIRNHILLRFERALYEADPEKRKRMLTFAVIGGGPTGVEYVGALAELIRGPLLNDYAGIDFKEVHLLLLEASGHLLPGLSPRLESYALKRLQKMGVDVRLGAQVTRISEDGIALKDGTFLALETSIWTAGVRGVPPQAAGLPLLPNRQVKVLPSLQLERHPEVYIAGDLAHVEEKDRPLPMVAFLAMQEGETAARNILRQLQKRPILPFHYHDLGTLAVIGRNSAAVAVFGLEFTGFPAWLFWVGLHIFRLIGFRNRLLVLVNWAWDYLFFERGVRLVVRLPRER